MLLGLLPPRVSKALCYGISFEYMTKLQVDPPTRKLDLEIENELSWITARRPSSQRIMKDWRRIKPCFDPITLIDKKQKPDCILQFMPQPAYKNEFIFQQHIKLDYFNPIEEFSDYENYTVMPWTPEGIKNIPHSFQGKSFQSSTCAGRNF